MVVGSSWNPAWAGTWARHRTHRNRPRRRSLGAAENPVAAGVAVPLAWVAASQLPMGLDTAAADVLLVWQQHPWLVSIAAGTALLVRRER